MNDYAKSCTKETTRHIMRVTRWKLDVEGNNTNKTTYLSEVLTLSFWFVFIRKYSQKKEEMST